jgi:hypothetical protein
LLFEAKGIGRRRFAGQGPMERSAATNEGRSLKIRRPPKIRRSQK